MKSDPVSSENPRVYSEHASDETGSNFNQFCAISEETRGFSDETRPRKGHFLIKIGSNLTLFRQKTLVFLQKTVKSEKRCIAPFSEEARGFSDETGSNCTQFCPISAEAQRLS